MKQPTLFLLLTFLPLILFSQYRPSRYMTSNYPVSARIHDSLQAMKVPLLEIPEDIGQRQLPGFVDNSKNMYWPGMLDQYLFYSCEQYCGVAYVYGYEINRLRNQPGWYWENSYPTHYTWNFMNRGDRYTGVNFLQSLEVIRQQGHMTSNDYGLDTATSVLGWIDGYDKYYRGMFNRLKRVSAIEVNSTAGILALRTYLHDHLNGSPTGGIACFTTSAETLYGMPKLPPQTPEAGIDVILHWKADPNHGMTVVGYHDSIRYDVNHDGKYTNNIDITGDGIVDARDWEIGGFRIANSYGNWWADTGFVYALYRSFALNYDQGGLWNNRVYVVDADTAYRPLLTLKVSLAYNARNKIRMLAGVSLDTSRQIPEHVIDFPIFNFQGGNHPMKGYDTIPDATELEFGLDVTPLLNFVPSGQPARYFVMVEERDPDQTGSGHLQSSSLISYAGSPVEKPLNVNSLEILDNTITSASVVAGFQKPAVQVTTASLPSFSPPVPLHVQLTASGGRPPYDWTLAEDYVSKPVSTPEPLISGTSIQVHYETKSFASVALPFSFPFYGMKFDTIYVNYFGFICFEPQNLPAPYITDELNMLRIFPMIIPSFSQRYTYNAILNDGIWFEANANRAIIRWKASVMGYPTSSVNDFAVILYPDGRFEFCYGTMNNQQFVQSCYSGVSKGDDINYDIQPQWNANELSGKSILFCPPSVPPGIDLTSGGFLTLNEADPNYIYTIRVRAADAGRISDTKELTVSGGLSLMQELICDGDDFLKAGKQGALKLTVTNTGLQPLQNLVIKIRPADTLLEVNDSLLTFVTNLNAGQSVTSPPVFSFRLRQPLPDHYPVFASLIAESGGRSWRKDIVMTVASAEVRMRSFALLDGDNQRLDPGEVADLKVSIVNEGSLTALDQQMKLTSPDHSVAILTDSILHLPEVKSGAGGDYYYRVKASRDVPSGSEVTLQLTISDLSGIVKTINLQLVVGTKMTALLNLSTNDASVVAMAGALDSLHVGYDLLDAWPPDFERYSSVFLTLGTEGSGSYRPLSSEMASLARYLQGGGKLYLESYYMWYYYADQVLMPMFHYTTQKVPAYFYPDIKGVQGTFSELMNFNYSGPINYSIFEITPTAPAYSALTNPDTPGKCLEIAYPGETYRTIGTIAGFSSLNEGNTPSDHTTLMKRYLEFFGLNITGPYAFFHASNTSTCLNQAVTFTDDSYDNITSRSWEFPGGTPATSTGQNPAVVYTSGGQFDVTLTISDGVNTQTMKKKGYIKAGQCSGAGEHGSFSDLLTVYPNPAQDQVILKIQKPFNDGGQVIVCDLTGREVIPVQNIPAGQNSVSFSVAALSKGFYLVKLKTAGFETIARLVKN